MALALLYRVSAMAIAKKTTEQPIARRSFMTLTQTIQLAVLILVGSMATAFANDVAISTPGLSGYDPVAYFTDGKAVRGSGFHVTVQNGVTYAFASDEHKTLFKKSPEKFLPVYGGYCAYGVALGKKFVADPEIWKIVGGKLYLNLDKSIQQKWEKDIPGYIIKAEKNWGDIRDKNASDL
jgi:YHS domain-containing protein